MALHVTIASPEEALFEGEASFVLARTVEGEIGILAGHTPLLARLAEGEVKVRGAAGEQTFQVPGGFMTVKDDKVIVLAEAPSAVPSGEAPAPAGS